MEMHQLLPISYLENYHRLLKHTLKILICLAMGNYLNRDRY
jgi:hypothetical protein